MATYYVSNTGNDSNDGLTEQTPWQTLSKVSGATFVAGDFIKLKCGDVWREALTVHDAGTVSAQITYTKYGTGAYPRIYGSTTVATWTNQGGNIWKSNADFTVNPYQIGSAGSGNIWIVQLDATVSVGVYQTSTGALTGDNMWCYANSSIYLYSTSNPTTRYSAIEVELRTASLSLNKKSYITVDSIDIFFTGNCVYEGYGTSNSSGLIVRNCEFGYCAYPDGSGAGILFCYNNSLIENNIIHDIGRRGISLININSTYVISNIVIRNNVFYHGNHTTSVDLQLTGGYTGSIQDVYIYGNTIYDAIDRVSIKYPMQMFVSDQGAPGTITNVRIYKNTFKGTTGAAINISGAEDVKVWNNTFYKFNEIATADACFLWVEQSSVVDVKNNIFYSQLATATNYKGNIITTGTNCTITSDYNCVYRTSLSYTAYRFTDGSNYNLTNKAAITATLGWDAHSVYVNPVLFGETCFLTKTSPCINGGVSVGLPYIGLAPDIGCFGRKAVLTYKNRVILSENRLLIR